MEGFSKQVINLNGWARARERFWRHGSGSREACPIYEATTGIAIGYPLPCRQNRGAMTAAALRLKLTHRIAVVRQIAASLVLLGLIGTVVGFIIALSGVEPDQAADVKAISTKVSNLIAGMSTALYTTLVGSVLNVWLMANYHLLAGGTVKLISGLLEFGEENASA